MHKNDETNENTLFVDSFLAGELEDITPWDIAKHLKTIKEENEELFIHYIKQISHDLFGDILLELPEHFLHVVIEHIDIEYLALSIEELQSDDATDLIQQINEINPTCSEQILKLIDKQDAQDIKKLIKYEEDEAGAYMQTELLVSFKNEKILHVVQNLKNLKKEGELENIHQLFVVDKLGRLCYLIPLEDLITFDFELTVSENIKDLEEEYKPLHVVDDSSIDEAILMFENHDLSSLAVTSKSGKLLGRIVHDDISDIIQEKATEQIYNLAGIDDEVEHEESIKDAGKSRVFWLFINLATAILASLVIGLFEQILSQYVALAILMPIVASMGGNAGTQSLTVMVRQLALGEIDTRNAKNAIKKELIIACFNSLIFAFVMGLITYFWFFNERLGLVIGLAMVINLLSAGLIGSLVPLALKRMNIDPAVGSSVFLTTATDIIGFFAFLGLAVKML